MFIFFAESQLCYNTNMKLTITNDFNLNKIADSGQCFRFNQIEENLYQTIFDGKVLRIKKLGNNTYDFNCNKKEFETIWKKYFDLDTDYAQIRKNMQGNKFLKECASYGEGIRILNQDKWEMLISFIISQRKSIPAIKTSIERLCEACGDKIDDENYAFPSPVQIVSCKASKLEACGLGYRLPYILNAANMMYENPHLLEDLDKNTRGKNAIETNDELLLDELKKLHGVGDKVASCVALFGFHRLNFFPKDVWINRALADKFPNGYDYEKYAPYNGVVQQYIFYSYRSTNK